jgi:A/G-specific adenine glycosylase
MASTSLLLAWYDRHRRTLPWRGTREPYRVWLSEVMLQQTTVAAVIPRYARFLERFPGVEALAAAPWDQLAEEWAGLGYYARARNLHAAAQAVVARGGFPRDSAGLRMLPGIGAYTAAAVAAIAFDEPVMPVDGNVERVTARIFAEQTPLPAARARLARLAAGFMDEPEARARPGDFAQAMFDLGAAICTPRRPACAICPWSGECLARAEGIAESLPAKLAKKLRPVRHGVHFLLRDAEGHILLRRRPPEGLLGGMLEVPGTAWREAGWDINEAMEFAPAPADWRLLQGEARHGFTHFELRMRLLVARCPALPSIDGFEAHPGEGLALPTAMRRLLALDVASPGVAGVCDTIFQEPSR